MNAAPGLQKVRLLFLALHICICWLTSTFFYVRKLFIGMLPRCLLKIRNADSIKRLINKIIGIIKVKGVLSMRVVAPKPFTFGNGKRAVLLLHGFTGNTADVRMMARFLETKGYTCHAPQYKGHGVPPEELVHTGPEDWWKDVMDGYEFLKTRVIKKLQWPDFPLAAYFPLNWVTLYL